jgi:hypothetical protein
MENGKSSGHHVGGGVYLSRYFCPKEHCSINGTNLSNCLWKQNENKFQKLIIKTEKRSNTIQETSDLYTDNFHSVT